MISDFTDLEPLLSQYDPGTILVGPLRSLSISSSFRYFHIAAKGSKVYESVSLGFIEAETDAQRRRADIIEKLNGRFGEVMILDNRLEMAHAAHKLWPNQETARILAAAKLEANRGNQGFDGGSQVDVLPENGGQRLVDEVAWEPVTPAKKIDPALTNTASSASHQAQPMPLQPATTPAELRLPDATLNWPLSGDLAAAQKQRCSGFDEDDIGLALLGFESSDDSIPSRPVERLRRRREVRQTDGDLGPARADWIGGAVPPDAAIARFEFHYREICTRRR